MIEHRHTHVGKGNVFRVYGGCGEELFGSRVGILVKVYNSFLYKNVNIHHPAYTCGSKVIVVNGKCPYFNSLTSEWPPIFQTLAFHPLA